jgi:transcription antitermination factor NusA-like protein
MQQREDRVVIISGDASAMQEALRKVLERVFDRSGLPDGADRLKDRSHIIEVVVPEKSGSHLIGQRGERIKQLIEETHCDLHVVKEPMAELLDQKRVRVTASSVEDACNAVWRLQEVLGELASGGVLKTEHFDLREAYGTNGGGGSNLPAMQQQPRPERVNTREVPVRLLVSKDEAAWTVGKKGNKIMRLRDLAKVQLNDADSPPFTSTESVVEIALAPLERRVRVVQLIMEDLALRNEARQSTHEIRLLVPTDQFGSVMGHRGETIRSIMASTGANLQQHKAEKMEDGTEYRLRLVKVKGDIRQCVEVVRQVHNAIENRGRDSGAPGRPIGESVHFDHGYGAQFASSSSAPPSAPNGGAAGQLLWSSSSAPATSGPTYERLGAGAVAAELGGIAGGLSGSESASRRVALQLAMPNEEVARLLASESSGIAWRAGVQLSVGRGPGGVPILEVVGTAVGNSVACYLIQDRLFMMH